MIMFDDFEQLKRQVEELRRKADQLGGQSKEKRQHLKRLYGCKNLKAAKKLEKKLYAKVIVTADEYVAKKKTYEAELAKAKGKLK